jgi:hypothetical protein
MFRVQQVLRVQKVHKALQVHLGQQVRDQLVNQVPEVRKARPEHLVLPLRQAPPVLKDRKDQQDHLVLQGHKAHKVHKEEQVPKDLLHNYSHSLTHWE